MSMNWSILVPISSVSSSSFGDTILFTVRFFYSNRQMWSEKIRSKKAKKKKKQQDWAQSVLIS